MKKHARFQPLWNLLKETHPSKTLFCLALVLEIIGAVAAVLIPLQTRELVDTMSVGLGLPWLLLLLLLVLMLVNSLADGLAYYLSGKLGCQIVQTLRERLLSHMMYLPMPFLNATASAEPASRLVKDSNAFRNIFSQQLVPIVSAVINITLSVAILWWLDWQLSCVLLAVIVVAFLVIVPIASGLAVISKTVQAQEAAFLGRLNEVFACMLLVKTHDAETLEIERGQEFTQGLYRQGMKEVTIQSVLSPIMGIAMISAFIVILAYGAVRVEQGVLSIGSLIAFILYLFNIVMPLAQFSFFISGINTALGAAQRLCELMNTPIEQVRQGRHDFQVSKSIYLQDVCFSYDQKNKVIEQLSLEIPYGRITAMVGLSGSGKSTLFNLLTRLYSIDSGRILCGDNNINNISLSAWRQQFAYVSQDAQIMSGSVKENLVLGLSKSFHDHQLIDALQQAQLQNWYQSLPDGLDSEIFQAGNNLSGGQRQRFAIARAILRDPKILLLDEVTSSLDVETESLLQKALGRVSTGRTVIVAAHRLYTVQHADQIIMLDKGSLLGVGSHAQLMQTLPEYRSLVETQLLSIQSLAGTKHDNGFAFGGD